MKTDFAAIDNQTNMPVLGLLLQELFADGTIPFAHTNGILQQATQSLNRAVELGMPRNLVRDQAQVYRPTQVDTNE
jgi:hypothetical protein